MFAKLGLFVLIVVFGACTFVAGTMAPDSLRQPIAAFGARLTGKDVAITGDPAKLPSPVMASSPAPAAEPHKVGSAAPASPAAANKTAPVRLDSLLLTATVDQPAPGKGEPAYALQIGQFATEEDAEATVTRIEKAGLGLPLTTVATLDAENEPWSVVALGQFASSAAATHAAPRIQSVLDIRETPVIRLPPPAAPAQ